MSDLSFLSTSSSGAIQISDEQNDEDSTTTLRILLGVDNHGIQTSG